MENLAELRSLVQQTEKIKPTQSCCKFLYCGGTCGRPDCEERAFDVDLLRSPPPNVNEYFHVNLERCGGSLYVDLFRSLPKVDNGLGATTGMPHLPAPAELEAKSKVALERCGESLLVDLSKSSPKVDNGFGATTGMPHLPAPAELEAKSKVDLERCGELLLVDLSKSSPKVDNGFGATTGMPHLSAPAELEAKSKSESVDSNFFTSNDSELPRIIELSSDSESPRRTYESLRINADPPGPNRKKATRQRALRSTIGRCVRMIKKRSLNTS